ncbi:ribonuclease H-like domain-containing protein [Tanacetum coccineum]
MVAGASSFVFKNLTQDGRRSGKQDESKALVTIDGEGVDWTSHSEEEEDYALMACNSSGSDTEVISCSKECKESYAKLKKLYDEQRAQLSDASIEIQAYTQALKKVEAQLVAHQKGQLWYEEKIRFMKIDLDDKTDVLTYHKKLLAEAEKVKEDLKAKVEKWHNSSKNLGKLLNTQMSANDKFGLGYGDYRYDGILSYENEVLQSVFMNKKSDLENQPLYDRFVTAEGMHAVPPPMTGNYMPSGPAIEIDYSQFTYGPKQSQPSESKTQTSDFDTCKSDCSVETHESLPEPTVNEPKVVSQPKVWSNDPIIEEYESDNEDEHVSLPTEEHGTPSFANQQVKTPRETIKNQFTHSKNSKVDKKELGYGFTTKACFVRIKLVWKQCERVNHKNQFASRAVLIELAMIQMYMLELVLLGEKGNAVKPLEVVIERHKKKHYWPQYLQYNGGSRPRDCATFKDPLFRPHDWNKAYLADYQDFMVPLLLLEDVLQHFNLFSMSQICDKKNKVLFTDSECLVLSPKFKLPDANQVLLRIPRQNNMYSFNLENIVPSRGLACLIAKATVDESNKWHRRLGHVNFKNLNKLVKGNLARAFTFKVFSKGTPCVACHKGSNTRASVKPNQFRLGVLLKKSKDVNCGILKDLTTLYCQYGLFSSTVKRSKVNNAGEEPTKHPDFQQVDKEDQVFLDKLERLKRQEQDANDAAGALRKEFA